MSVVINAVCRGAVSRGTTSIVAAVCVFKNTNDNNAITLGQFQDFLRSCPRVMQGGREHEGDS